MLLARERYCGSGMDALATVCSDALATVCSWHARVIVVCAWMLWSPYVLMLWSPYALGTRALLWFGHECSGHRVLLELERYYGFGIGFFSGGIVLCSLPCCLLCSNLQPGLLASPTPSPTPRALSPHSESTNLRSPWQNLL